MGNDNSNSGSPFSWIRLVAVVGVVVLVIVCLAYVKVKSENDVLMTKEAAQQGMIDKLTAARDAAEAKLLTFEFAREDNNSGSTLWLYVQVRGGKKIRFYNNSDTPLTLQADAGVFSGWPTDGVDIAAGKYHDTTVVEGHSDFKVLNVWATPSGDHGGADMIVGGGP